MTAVACMPSTLTESTMSHFFASEHARSGWSRRQWLTASAGLLTSAALPQIARAQGAWPDKPIRIVAGQAPGSSNDAAARALGDYLSTKLGVPVVVENKPGGIGMIAADTVARAPADGYTLLLTLHSQPAQAPALLKRMPVDPDKDLVPIAAMGVGPVTAVVHKDFPAKTLQEVIAYAKKKPVNVGNYAVGSGWQLMLEQLAKDTGAQFNVVNYKGTGAMLMDLYGGQIDMGAGSLAGIGSGIQQGNVRPVVITSGPASSRLPGIPTWKQAGFVGGAYENLPECNMLFARTGTPQAIVDRLAQLVVSSYAESDRIKGVRDTLADEEPVRTGKELRAFIDRTWTAYRQLTKESGLTPS